MTLQRSWLVFMGSLGFWGACEKAPPPPETPVPISDELRPNNAGTPSSATTGAAEPDEEDANGYDRCADKACGERCTICPPGAADCFETAVVKTCDAEGRCTPTAGPCP